MSQSIPSDLDEQAPSLVCRTGFAGRLILLLSPDNSSIGCSKKVLGEGAMMVLFQVPLDETNGPRLLCAFRCVLYDSRVFCYPLPQFAGVNLTLVDPFLESHSRVPSLRK